jgi:nucleolar protein 58
MLYLKLQTRRSLNQSKTLLQSSKHLKRHKNCKPCLISSVKLHAFKKFKDNSEAVSSLEKLLEGDMPKDLKTFLKKNIISKEIQDHLLCKMALILGYDKKVALAIKGALDIDTKHGEELFEVFRGIRSQLGSLLSGKYYFL